MAKQIPFNFEFGAAQTFDQYAAGENLEIVEQLKQLASYQQPITEQFIYLNGKPGFGKTHLLQATCQLAQLQGLSVFYLPLELNSGLKPEVLNDLEALDLVCLDDIDNIATHNDWEQALFHLFNRMRDNNKPLIVTSEVPPNQSPVVLPDLKSRLAWGLSYRLQPLSEGTQLDALLLRSRNAGIDLSEGVARYLLSHYSRDLNSQWQRLESLNQASLSAQRKLTIPFVKRFLGIEA